MPQFFFIWLIKFTPTYFEVKAVYYTTHISATNTVWMFTHRSDENNALTKCVIHRGHNFDILPIN